MGGFVSDVVDSVVGVANDVLGGNIADDLLGLDPNGGGIVPTLKAVAPAALAYFTGGLGSGAGLGDLFTASAADAMGPMTAEALGSSFASDMAANGILGTTVAEMGPWDAGTLGGAFEDYMTSQGYDPTVMSGIDMGMGGSTATGPTLRNLFSGMSGGSSKSFPWLQTGMGLYDMYNRNKAANTMNNRFNSVNQQINSLYAPGTPEYNALWNEMSRKDAAAGRNSQYGPRAVDLGAKIAGIRGNLLAQTLQPQNNMLTAGLATGASSLGSLANLWGQQTGTTDYMNSMIGKGLNSAVNYGINGIKDLFNW